MTPMPSPHKCATPRARPARPEWQESVRELQFGPQAAGRGEMSFQQFQGSVGQPNVTAQCTWAWRSRQGIWALKCLKKTDNILQKTSTFHPKYMIIQPTFADVLEIDFPSPEGKLPSFIDSCQNYEHELGCWHTLNQFCGCCPWFLVSHLQEFRREFSKHS